MAKLVDAPDSKSGFERSAGSSPAPGTTAKADKVQNLPAFFVCLPALVAENRLDEFLDLFRSVDEPFGAGGIPLAFAAQGQHSV